VSLGRAPSVHSDCFSGISASGLHHDGHAVRTLVHILRSAVFPCLLNHPARLLCTLDGSIHFGLRNLSLCGPLSDMPRQANGRRLNSARNSELKESRRCDRAETYRLGK